MKTRKAKLIVSKGGSGSTTFRATLPTKWVRAIGLSEEIRDMKIFLQDNRIIIEKE